MSSAGRIRAVLLCAALFCMSGGAAADTIVLKNGHKIVVLSVTIEGDKVHYETRNGTLTLPKSIVDHIDGRRCREPGDCTAGGTTNQRWR